MTVINPISVDDDYHAIAHECVNRGVHILWLQLEVGRLKRELEHERALSRAAALELAKRELI